MKSTTRKPLESKANPIYFADVLPGAGKTLWAIEKMRDCIDKKKGIILYVAPTHDLLDEVERKLVINTRASCVHHIRATNDGESTSVALRLKIDGGVSRYGATIKPCSPGTVLLCTHETFLYLTTDVNSSMYIKRRAEVNVIFDEARKCVLSETKFSLPRDATSAFLETFIHREDAPAGHEFGRVHLKKDVLDTEAFDAIFSRSSKLRRFRSRVLQQLTAIRGDSNIEMYASIKRMEDAEDTEFLFQTMLVPRHAFHGWKKAVLLAAFFKNSQMYHLLAQYDVSSLLGTTDKSSAAKYDQLILSAGGEDKLCKLIDISTKVVRAARVNAILKRYKALTVTYISPNTSFTMFHLRNSVLVGNIEPDTLAEFTLAYRAWSRKRGHAHIPLAASLPEVFSASPDPELVRMFKLLKIHTEYSRLTPLRYYVRAAFGLCRRWLSQHRMKKETIPMLVNIGTTEGSSSRNRHWVQDVMKVVPDPADNLLEVPFVNHGLNRFKELNTLAFLATLNPTPTTARLFRQLCPSYNPKLDHTVDQAIQTAMRISIRDTSSRTKPLVVVTDRPLAEAIVEHLQGVPSLVEPQSIFSEFPNLDPFFLPRETHAEKKVRLKANPELATKMRAKQANAMARSRERNAEQIKYIKENSKYVSAVNTLSIKVTRLKKDGKPFEKQKLELTALREKAKMERKELIAEFKKGQSNG